MSAEGDLLHVVTADDIGDNRIRTGKLLIWGSFAVMVAAFSFCALAQAERVARALCRAVEEYQYVWEDRTFRVGCSIGLVPISDSSASAAWRAGA